jgi:hypothetical protein
MAKNTIQRTDNGTVEKATPIQRFIKILELEALETAEDSATGKEISAQITSAMFEADTLEEAIALQDAGLLSGKDMVDVDQEIRSFEVVKSEERFRDSSPLGYYLRIHALRLDTLEEVTYATGAPNVVNLVWKARNTDRLPLQCVIRSRPTANGELLSVKLLAPRPIQV